MIRLAALFFVAFSALSLWAAPAAAHGGLHHSGHQHIALVKTSTPLSVQSEHHVKSEQISDRAYVLSDHVRAAVDTTISTTSVDHSAPLIFVSSQDKHDEDCCNTGAICSTASAALLTSPGFKQPVTAPARLPLSCTETGTGRIIAPTLQPPKLIA